MFIPQAEPEWVFQFHKGATGLDILKALHFPLDRFVAVQVGDQIQDLSLSIPEDHTLHFIERQSSQGLSILRHTAAHVLAQAVKELYPEVQVTIGPVIEDGFYYDFYRPEPFQAADLEMIEARMKDIVGRDLSIARKIYSREEAMALFQKEPFKVEIINSIPEGEPVSVYIQGDFSDICRGPHLSSTGQLGLDFKLTKVSGAYWRGDSRNVQLQRIYGTAWTSATDLESYLLRIEEAQKRDHRRLGAQMDLFHFQEEAPGCVFWHPKGWTLYRLLQDYIRAELQKHHYQEVHTPQLIQQSLWQASGHWDKFKEHMFVIEHENMTYALKPMNCPCHVQIFNQKLYSHHDLPLRLSEFGSCARYEPSGARAGLMRLTSFVIDDAHIFCTPEQLVSETVQFCQLLFSIYHSFGFQEVIVRLATRPTVRLGNEALWDHAEASLQQGADAAGLSYTIFPGEGAFYGPKLEFVLKDNLGRLWQCGTFQVDFVLPERLHARYIGADGKKHTPVMLHRAILGSMERFMGVLLEHTAGHLPFWLSPVQGIIMNISDKTISYAQRVKKTLQNFRLELDLRNEKIGYKIRQHTMSKIPCLLIVGEKEENTGTVMLRQRDHQEVIPLDRVPECLQSMMRTG